jgi:hypothetical protein
MTREINGLSFEYVSEIVPESDINGNPKEFFPQSRYKNINNISFHKYGNGSFCRFKIQKENNGKTGVYVILVDNNLKYVGECENLGMRFNNGYGNIYPRNCFEGGRSTNCRINKLILEAFRNHSKIELFFYETEDIFDIETRIKEKFSPEWNKK